MAVEPERYEFFEPPIHSFELDRREFFKVLGAGIAVVCLLPPSQGAEAESRRFAAGKRDPAEIGAWLYIGEDGMVTVYSGKVEMGQNIRTSLTQVVAEELPVPISFIHMILGDTDLTPYDAGTFGSQTTPRMASQLRIAAASARELLLDLAAQKWSVKRDALTIGDGKITNANTKDALTFGQLIEGREIMQTVTDTAPTIPAKDWKIAGTSLSKIDGRDFVTGKVKFISGLKLPDMQFGKILRPPAFGATLTSLDTQPAEAMPGVTVVRDGDFIGVTAPDEHTASKAVAAIRAEWKTTPQPSNAELFEHLKKNARESQGGGRGASPNRIGSIEAGMSTADIQLRQTYTIDYIAHVPLEPRAALANWEDGKLTVWTGTQRPFGVQQELMRAFRLPEDRVRVIMPATGSGYGGKHTGEAAVEAARLAQAAGKPVKLIWTREEEFTWAYFRPAGVIEVSSGVKTDGVITACELHNYNSGAAGIQSKYDFPNQLIQFHANDSPLRQGSYRCLAAPANHFAREVHMDELAHAVGMEPLAFRLKNIKDERIRNVLERAAQKFGWGKEKSTPERGFGIAGGFEKNSYMANCVEIAIDRKSGQVKVVRVVLAFDCGPVLNPNQLNNQIEGMIMMGIGGALFESIRFENGKILNSRLSDYRVPRFSDTPIIETVLIDPKNIPSAGGGETPIVGIAPAISNAIFAATGLRLRTLPLVPEGIKI
ncbi:MAG: isoquinoline 1-oxidoreductase [Candidatus Omnitrophota bacterium]|nr:MAG: isoquinoline 1-oxidoreductase [Candidatus Omnitrophota bacterium]